MRAPSSRSVAAVTLLAVAAAVLLWARPGHADTALNQPLDARGFKAYGFRTPVTGTEPLRLQDVAICAGLSWSVGVNGAFRCSVDGTDYLSPSTGLLLGGHAATSIVGRAVSGTGVAADISCPTPGTFLGNVGGTLSCAAAAGVFTPDAPLVFFGSHLQLTLDGTSVGVSGGAVQRLALTFTGAFTGTMAAGSGSLVTAFGTQAGLSLFGVAGSSPAAPAPIVASGAVPEVPLYDGSGAIAWSPFVATSIPGATVYADGIVTGTTQLASVASVALGAGTIAYVNSVDDGFQLKADATTADNITHVAASGKTGYEWVRMGIVSRRGGAVSVWNVDPSGGNDENDGTTLALKTYAEWSRRTQGTTLTGATTVNLLNDAPDADSIVVRCTSPSFTVSFVGSQTVVSTQTVTSAQARSATSNLANEITVTGFDWSPYLNTFVRVQGTSNYAAVTKVVSSGRARLGELWNTSTSSQAASGGITAGQVIELVHTRKAPLLFAVSEHVAVSAVDLAFSGTGSANFKNPFGLANQNLTTFQRVIFNGSSTNVFSGAFFVGGLIAGGGTPTIYSPLLQGTAFTVPNVSFAGYAKTRSAVLQGTTVNVVGPADFHLDGDLGQFDLAPGATGLRLSGTTASGEITEISFNSGRHYGSGNDATARMWAVGPGDSVIYQAATPPTMDAGLGVVINGVSVAIGSLPVAFNPTTGSAVYANGGTATAGVLAQDTAGNLLPRTFTSTGGTVTITNPTGGGNINLEAASAGLADPGSNGIVVRTALNTTTSRTLINSDGTINFTNPSGVAGNPEIHVNAIPESKVTGLTTDLGARVPTTRTINTTAPMTGGGALSSDLTLAVPNATTTTAGLMSATDKLRVNGAVTPTLTTDLLRLADVYPVGSPCVLQTPGSLGVPGCAVDLSVADPFAIVSNTLTLKTDATLHVVAGQLGVATIGESLVTNLVTDLAGKQATGNYLTGLSSAVTATGPGTVTATVHLDAGSTVQGLLPLGNLVNCATGQIVGMVGGVEGCITPTAGTVYTGTSPISVSGSIISCPTCVAASGMTNGSVLFWNGGVAQDNSGFFYDGTNHRLGLGTTTPSYPIDIVKTVNAEAVARITNLSSGSSAAAEILASNSSGQLAYLGVASTGYSGFAPWNGGSAYFGSFSTQASIFTQNANPIVFYTNTTEVGRWLSGGGLEVENLTSGMVKSSGAGLLLNASGGTDYEFPLTFSTGLSRSVNTITANLSTGKAGGQTAFGGTAAGETLTLSSTASATKGEIDIGALGQLAIVEARGDVVVGAGLTTGATGGFFYMPSSNGAPTGTPSTYSSFGVIATEIDRSHNRLYAYLSPWAVIGQYDGSFGPAILKTDAAGIHSAASAADLAAAQTWPAATDVLVSTGPSTAPTGGSGLTFGSGNLAVGNSVKFGGLAGSSVLFTDGSGFAATDGSFFTYNSSTHDLTTWLLDVTSSATIGGNLTTSGAVQFSGYGGGTGGPLRVDGSGNLQVGPDVGFDVMHFYVDNFNGLSTTTWMVPGPTSGGAGLAQQSSAHPPETRLAFTPAHVKLLVHNIGSPSISGCNTTFAVSKSGAAVVSSALAVTNGTANNTFQDSGTVSVSASSTDSWGVILSSAPSSGAVCNFNVYVTAYFFAN